MVGYFLTRERKKIRHRIMLVKKINDRRHLCFRKNDYFNHRIHENLDAATDLGKTILTGNKTIREPL